MTENTMVEGALREVYVLATVYCPIHHKKKSTNICMECKHCEQIYCENGGVVCWFPQVYKKC